MNENMFQLDNRPVPGKRWRPEPEQPLRQTVLFAGLHCMAGQLDLFPTDGPAERQQEQETHESP